MKINVPNPIAAEEITAVSGERRERQLGRLLLIIDVLYALMIYKIFTLMPSVDTEQLNKENIIQVLGANGMRYAMMGVGLIMTIIYWGQNNMVSGNLKRTSGSHAFISILQTFCMMIYLYFMRLDIEIAPDPIILQMESLFLALAGFGGVLAWYVAYKNRLTTEHVDEKEYRSIRTSLLGEPIVAVITIPLALIGPSVWTVSFVVLLVIVNVFLKRREKRIAQSAVQ